MKLSRETKIGIVGVIALALLFYTIQFLQGVNIFSTADKYYINFADAKGLAKSSPVYADGYNVGIVSSISYDTERPGSGVIVEVSVDHGMRIPAGTVAVLDEAMLGGCTLNLRMGNSPVQRFAVGDTIPSQSANGLMAKAANLVPKLEATLAKVDTLLTTLNALASDPNIRAILANANTLTANLDRSSAQLNTLLANDVPAMVKTFDQAGQHVTALTDTLAALDLAATLAHVDGTLHSVQTAVEHLNDTDNSLGLLLNDTTIYGELNRTVTGAADLLEDIKAHPKRYVHFSVFGKKN
ncbi:MAG: MCE family protein [Bacteroidaceae bacterium]|nr:MCE family protein [Bacteroidaceae bacterium]